jgi:large subunit ribosomal protein L10
MENKTHITPAKEEAVKLLRDEFEQYNGFIFTDYRGMTVEQVTALRKDLLKNDSQFRVVKNSYAKIAMRDLGMNDFDDLLVGPTAIALAKGDTSNEVAKALYASISAGNPMQVKSAFLDGKVFSADEVEAYSKLPGRLELISLLMGTMKAPVQKVAATLLAYVEKNSGEVAEATDAE